MLGRGIFERDSFEKFMQHARRRDTAVEVGSHVGSWTIGLSKLFRKVIGFEPQPENRKYLDENIARADAKNIKIHPFAVTDIKQDFSISANGATRNSGMAYLIPEHCANDNAIPVECVRLDDIISMDLQKSSLDALKIDVEGMELEVLRSGVELIKEHKPTIILEINRHCARYGFTKEDILDHMNDTGYHQADKIRHDYIFVPN